MEKIISKTPLHGLHKNLKAKMAPFAGYDMPLSYPLGTVKEHLWCRKHAGLFDVSHMGQLILVGEGGDNLLSSLTPTNFTEKPLGKCTYSVLLNDQGGMIDDLIATRIAEDKIYLVVNAACKEKDIAYIKDHLTACLQLDVLPHRALMALQGPQAEMVLQKLVDVHLADLPFMTFHEMAVGGVACYVSRSGYTGEDGFEISVDAKCAETLWQKLSESEWVEPIGLAARDTLRLEAGLPLYGQDLSEEITPIEASLKWILSKDHQGYKGASYICDQMREGVLQKRVGIELLDKGIARAYSPILNEAGVIVGELTSGGYGPSVENSIGMGYIQTAFSEIGTPVFVDVRGRKLKAQVVSSRFYKK
jgi:aminomethyltransferase